MIPPEQAGRANHVKQKAPQIRGAVFLSGDPSGIRTRVTGVRGRNI